MSYTGSVSGVLVIDPPLKWSEIKASRFYLEDKVDMSFETAVVLAVDQADKETDEGVSVIFTSNTAIPWRESFDCRGLERDVRALAKDLAETGHTLHGVMTVSGDWVTDVWRVVADENGVRKEKACFTWPDGSAVEL